MSKITTGCLWNFSFLEVCMDLIANFTCKDTIFKRIWSSFYGIFLNWTYRSIVHKCFKKRCLRTKMQLQIIECNLANMLIDISPKNCVQKLCIWRPGRRIVCILHVHFTFVFFWDEVRSKKIQKPYQIWYLRSHKGFISFTLFFIY